MDLASKSLYYLCADSCRCHLEAARLVIHHTVSFSPVVNTVIGWTLKLPGGWKHGSPLGGSGSSASHRRSDQRVFRSDSPEHVSSAWIPVPVSLRCFPVHPPCRSPLQPGAIASASQLTGSHICRPGKALKAQLRLQRVSARADAQPGACWDGMSPSLPVSLRWIGGGN